jgi:hypothetical protein
MYIAAVETFEGYEAFTMLGIRAAQGELRVGI